jgi:hypothetical protein
MERKLYLLLVLLALAVAWFVGYLDAYLPASVRAQTLLGG